MQANQDIEGEDDPAMVAARELLEKIEEEEETPEVTRAINSIVSLSN